MKNYPAFLLLIKTDEDKFIATFVDSKFENTKGMKYKVDGETYDAK